MEWWMKKKLMMAKKKVAKKSVKRGSSVSKKKVSKKTNLGKKNVSSRRAFAAVPERIVHPPRRIPENLEVGSGSHCFSKLLCLASMTLFVFAVLSLFISVANFVVSMPWWIWLVLSIILGLKPMMKCASGSCRF